MTLPCGWCDYPDPADGDRRVRIVVDEDEKVDACRSCAARLLLAHYDRVTLVIEPVYAVSS